MVFGEFRMVEALKIPKEVFQSRVSGLVFGEGKAIIIKTSSIGVSVPSVGIGVWRDCVCLEL